MSTPNIAAAGAARRSIQQRGGAVAGGPRSHAALPAAKTRFNAYLSTVGLPDIDNLQNDDVNYPGEIKYIMGGWGDHMKRNPPRYLTNANKVLDSSSVGNAFGLIKEHLKSKFPNHVDWNDDSWFTMQKADVLSSLSKTQIRGADGTDEGPGKVGW